MAVLKIFDGTKWVIPKVDSVPAASQAEVDIGTVSNKYVSPLTLKNKFNNELWGTFKDFLMDGDIVVYDAINAETLYNLNGGLLRIWKGTQTQYDALPSVTKNNADFIFFIKG